MDVKSLMPWKRSDVANSHNDEAVPFMALHRSMNRMFDDFFRDFDLPTTRNKLAVGWPNVELSEDDKQIRIIAELPGLDEKDIDLSLRDGILTLKGEKKNEVKSAIYTERWHGQFSRAFEVGNDVDPDKVKASFEKGILTIMLDKIPEPQSRTHKISITHRD